MSARLVLLLGLLAAGNAVAGRRLVQVPPAGAAPRRPGCEASPGVAPPECTNTLGPIGGNQWQGDEIECHVGDYQLKCDVNTEVFGTSDIRCELDRGVAFNALEFTCALAPNCRAACNPADLDRIVPGGIRPTVDAIFEAWIPEE